MALDAVQEGEAIGALLKRAGWITAERLDEARREAAEKGARLATALYASGALDLGALTRALSSVHGVEGIAPERMAAIDPAVVRLLPARVCARALAIPVRLSEAGLDVVFADPADESAVRDVRKAAGRPLTVAVTAEPLLYYALRVHGIAGRIPHHLEPLVDELVSTGLSSAPRRAPVPAHVEEFHTTPMGGVAPHLPDEVSTPALRVPAPDVIHPEELLGPSEGAFAAAQSALDGAEGLDAVAEVLLAFASGGARVCSVLRREGEGFLAVRTAGPLAASGVLAPADRPTVLSAALSGESGYQGSLPGGSAKLPLFAGRTPPDLLLLPVRRTPGREALLHAEAGNGGLDAAFVERLRALALRARAILDE